MKKFRGFLLKTILYYPKRFKSLFLLNILNNEKLQHITNNVIFENDFLITIIYQLPVTQAFAGFLYFLVDLFVCISAPDQTKIRIDPNFVNALSSGI